MGLYARAQKVAGGDRRATYSFTTTGDYAPRTLVIDNDEDRIWPEDGNRDGIFHGAAAAIIRGYRREGRLPDVALHQS
jgi:hypothetical protein